MLIAKGNLKQGQLAEKTIIVTGAAGGIGYECARALLWLGAKVIIADIDASKGVRVEQDLQEMYGDRVRFVHTDVGCKESVEELAAFVEQHFGRVDGLINNATIAVVGGVKDLPIEKWDKSYNVNLRGPILLTRRFLPQMLDRNEGVVMFVSSSGAAPYLGGYEVFKTAQVELANTLAAELENTGVCAFTIGPGIIKTEAAHKAICEIAPLYGMTVEAFYNLNASQLLSVEAAGAGFAAAVALAKSYRGLEIGSIQALTDVGIIVETETSTEQKSSSHYQAEHVKVALKKVHATLHDQVQGWYARNIFERQWIFRDFRKHVGATAEVFLQQLSTAILEVEAGRSPDALSSALEKLIVYYGHLLGLMKGYERNPDKAKEHAAIINEWIEEIEAAKKFLGD